MNKKIITIILSLIMITLVGCSNNDKKNNFEYSALINSLISVDTYSNISFDEEPEIYQSKLYNIFENYLTDKNALDTLYANRTFSTYKNYFENNNVSKIEQLKIDEVERKEMQDYTYIRCNVTYICKTNNKDKNMTDSIVINLKSVNNKSVVSDICVNPTSSSIYKK